MAYDDSEALQPDNSYSLGSYTFGLNVSYIHEPDEDLVAISAICNGPDGRRESTPIYAPNGTTVESWSVEANETEASVYVKLKGQELDTGDVPVPVPASASLSDGPYNSPNHVLTASWTVSGGVGTGQVVNGKTKIHLMAAGSPDGSWQWVDSDGETGSGGINNQFTFQGKTVYYHVWTNTFQFATTVSPSTTGDLVGHAAAVAWTMIYGVPDKDAEDKLVGRFAIDIREADPEDWDEPGDTGDPSYTLNVYVTGASAGTHNSENIPLDGEIQSVYGSGGNGGNGGGGGAGASTVIIYEFTTDKAGSVNQEAYAREAGAGGPGGPGGRGADGCIIIFY